MGFPPSSNDKETACSAGDLGSVPGSGRSIGEGNGYPLQYSYLENSMDRGACRAIVHGVTESDTIEQITLSYTQSAVKKSTHISFETYIYIYIYLKTNSLRCMPNV